MSAPATKKAKTCEEKSDVPTTIKLASGATMPLVGLGTWKSTEGQAATAVKAAIDAGYKHIDCAACYGNEIEVGTAFKAAFDSGKIKREDLFVTSKLWNSEHAPKDVEAACRQTLEDLQLDYLDLYLIHWPQAFAKTKENEGTNRSFPTDAEGNMMYDVDTPLEATWGAMESLVGKGLVKSIGLSNFNSLQINAINKVAKIPVSVLQVESHPYHSQNKLLQFCTENKIVITAYSPLGSGAEIDGNTIVTNTTLKAIGEKYGRSGAQVAVAWQRQRGIVVIPKSVRAERIVQNFDVFFELSDVDMKAIAGLNKDIRVGFGGPKAEGEEPRDAGHPNYPFKADIEF